MDFTQRQLADLGATGYWPMNRQTDYGILNDLVRHKTNNSFITTKWDDMLRATASLQMGAVKPSDMA